MQILLSKHILNLRILVSSLEYISIARVGNERYNNNRLNQ